MYISECKLHFSQTNLFFAFFLQAGGVFGDVRILKEGTTVSYSGDNDVSHSATIIGNAIVDMQPGQNVSDSFLFYVA